VPLTRMKRAGLASLFTRNRRESIAAPFSIGEVHFSASAARRQRRTGER
jgi:hypothetical protein